MVVRGWRSISNYKKIMSLSMIIPVHNEIKQLKVTIKKLIKQGKDIVDLSLGQSDFKSPKHAVDAAIQALKDGHHGYTLPNGTIECRESVSRKIKSLYKADISPERIIIMPGGKPTMHLSLIHI